MSVIDSIRSNLEVLQYFNEKGPFCGSDFLFQIHSQDVEAAQLVLTAFSIPALGISFSPSNEYLTFNEPNLSVNELNISFIETFSNLKDNRSPVFNLHAKQYNESGTLKFIPDTQLPFIKMSFDSAGHGNFKPFVRFDGCKFSCPIPTVNLASTDKSVFSSRVSYSNYEILL